MIRRILPSELIDLERLQIEGIQYSLYYPRHLDWVQKALREIEQGRRRAYGYFGTIISANKNIVNQLLGAIMLRVSSGDVVEIKNLVVRRKSDGQHFDVNRDSIGRGLIAKVVEASRRRGFSRLEIELPSDIKEQISWFMEENFQVQSARESRHTHIPFYLLHREITPYYRGDPFDCKSMSRWLLSRNLGWKVVGSEEPILNSGRTICHRLRFILHRSVESESVSGQVRPAVTNRIDESLFLINGDCLVDSGKGPTSDLVDIFKKDAERRKKGDVSEGTSDVHFFTSTRDMPLNEDLYRIYGIRAITGSKLLNYIGYWDTDGTVQLEWNSVAGIIIQVGTAFVSAFDRRCSTDQQFDYFVTNGIGEVLNAKLTRIAKKTPQYAIFCEAEADSVGHLNVIGVAEIDEVRPKFASEVAKSQSFDGLSNAEFILDPFTANFNGQDLVWRFRFVNLKRVTNPFVLTNCVSKAVEPFIEHFAGGDLLPCYADSETIQNVLQKARFAPAESKLEQPENSKLLSERVIDLLIEVLAIVENTPWLQRIAGQLERDQINKRKNDLRNPPLMKSKKSNRSLLKYSGELFSKEPSAASAIEASLSRAQPIVEEWTSRKSKGATVGEVNELARRACAMASQLIDCANDFLVTEHEGLIRTLREVRQWLGRIVKHKHRFAVSLSFRGDPHRPLIRDIANELAMRFTKARVLFDEYHEAELARCHANELLRTLYFNETELVVVFLTSGYIEDSKWTSTVEWGQIRRFVRQSESRRIMLIQLSEIDMERFGLNASRDITLRASQYKDGEIAKELVSAIIERHRNEFKAKSKRTY